MVFKVKTVEERLKFLQETIDKLNQLRVLTKDEFLKDFGKYWAGEHGLHLAAEAIFDIGNHILVGQFGEHPKGYNDIVPLLSEKGVISSDLSHRFDQMGGFRNILVHEYMRVDKEKVFDRLQKGLADFEEFVKQILSWLETKKT